jgi:hypothetical protein
LYVLGVQCNTRVLVLELVGGKGRRYSRFFQSFLVVRGVPWIGMTTAMTVFVSRRLFMGRDPELGNDVLAEIDVFNSRMKLSKRNAYVAPTLHYFRQL